MTAPSIALNLLRDLMRWKSRIEKPTIG